MSHSSILYFFLLLVMFSFFTSCQSKEHLSYERINEACQRNISWVNIIVPKFTKEACPCVADKLKSRFASRLSRKEIQQMNDMQVLEIAINEIQKIGYSSLVSCITQSQSFQDKRSKLLEIVFE